MVAGAAGKGSAAIDHQKLSLDGIEQSFWGVTTDILSIDFLNKFNKKINCT